MTDFTGKIARIGAFSVGSTTLQNVANLAANLQVPNTPTMESIVIGALNDDDVNVLVNLNIVAPVTFNAGAAIGSLTLKQNGSALPELSTITTATGATPTSTGVSSAITTTGAAISANTVLQTIAATALLSMIPTDAGLSELPFGAYTAAVTSAPGGGATGDITATVTSNGSLELKATTALTIGTYTITLSNSANPVAQLATFNVVVS